MLFRSNTSDTLTLNNYVTVYPYPAPQGISQSGDTLFANQGAVTYQWYYNGNSIAGATDYFYVAQASGSYNVVCTDVNDCEVEAVIFDVMAGVSEGGWKSDAVSIMPNPFTGEIKISAAGQLQLFDNLGQKVLELKITDKNIPVDLSFLPKGIFMMQFETRGKVFQQKIVKM